MDNGRVAGGPRRLRGSIKQTAGKTAGEATPVPDGKTEKFKGKIHNAVTSSRDIFKR